MKASLLRRKSFASRRSFLKGCVYTAASAPFLFRSAAGFSGASDSAIPYEPKLVDRLWMWGHGPGTTDTLYAIPKGDKIDQADAIRSMGIPNLCVIRWLNSPEPENDDDPTKPAFGQFCEKIAPIKRLAWSIIDGAPQPYEQKKGWAFEAARTLPNMTTFFLDDFFTQIPDGDSITEVKAHLTVEQLRSLRDEIAALPRKCDLAAVLYSGQLDPGIRPYLDQCDVVSFWTWAATDLTALEANFGRYREILPEKRTLLGIYMWDFGNMRPVTPELMTLQLDFALDMFRKKQVEGVIFHCTPLCDIGLDAVEVSRRWIEEHANESV